MKPAYWVTVDSSTGPRSYRMRADYIQWFIDGLLMTGCTFTVNVAND